MFIKWSFRIFQCFVVFVCLCPVSGPDQLILIWPNGGCCLRRSTQELHARAKLFKPPLPARIPACAQIIHMVKLVLAVTLQFGVPLLDLELRAEVIFNFCRDRLSSSPSGDQHSVMSSCSTQALGMQRRHTHEHRFERVSIFSFRN